MRNLSNIMIEDLKLANDQINKQPVKDLFKIDEMSKYNNPKNKFIDIKHVLKDSNQVKIEIKIDDKNNNGKLN